MMRQACLPIFTGGVICPTSHALGLTPTNPTRIVLQSFGKSAKSAASQDIPTDLNLEA